MEIQIAHRCDSYAANARWAYAALGTGLALIVLFIALSGTAVGPWAYLAGAAYGTALSVVGAIRMPRIRRHIWIALAAAQGLFLLGDGIWTLCVDVLHVEPSPTADVGYLASYPAFALGLAWLVRGRQRGRDRAAFLDAAILTTCAAVVAIVFYVAPAAQAAGTGRLGWVVGVAYPAGDLLLLAVAFRLLTTVMKRNVALWGLLGAAASLLLADLCYAVTVVNGTSYPGWVDGGYLLSYLLLGFAAVHPSVDTLSESAPYRADRLTASRITLLGGALVLVPATGQIAQLTGFRHDSWVLFFGGCVSALLVVLRVWALVQDLQRKAVQLAALARKDGLTGVPNRRTWDHELSRACAMARETGEPLSVAVLDMDHFKEFNDTHGHLAGDLVLKETTAAWAAILRGGDVLARYGGEEFTVLLPGLSADKAHLVLERLRNAVTHEQTCSIGVATWDLVETPAELVARADTALYRAKRAGRDRVVVHHEVMAEVVELPVPRRPTVATHYAAYESILG
jgi:diguanylate cyclase